MCTPYHTPGFTNLQSQLFGYVLSTIFQILSSTEKTGICITTYQAVVLIFGGQLYLFSTVILLNVLHMIIISARVEHYIWICTLKNLPIFFLFKWIFKVSQTKIVLNFNLYINVTDLDQDHKKQIPWCFLLFNLIENPKYKNTWYCRCTCFQY